MLSCTDCRVTECFRQISQTDLPQNMCWLFSQLTGTHPSYFKMRNSKMCSDHLFLLIGVLQINIKANNFLYNKVKMEK